MDICADIMKSIHSDIRGKNYYTALELERRGEKILKLNTGNPATFGFQMPQSVKEALWEQLDCALGYCDVRGMLPARAAIWEYHRTKGLVDFDLDDIFIGNGISEIAEDDQKKAEKDLQDLLDKNIKKVDAALAAKEKELMAI